MDPNFVRGGLTNDKTDRTLEAMLRATSGETEEMRLAQDTSADAFLKSVTEVRHPFKEVKSKRKMLKDRQEAIQRGQKTGTKAESRMSQQKMKEIADRFESKNSELKSKMLISLRENINSKDTRDDIIRKVTQYYQDPAIADEALDFLEETCSAELAETVREAKAEMHDKHGREIAAGRNIGAKAREFAAKGLGTPTSLRDMYRDITGNPRDSVTLFLELADKYPYKDLKDVMKFLFHSLGTDLRSKGPSIPKGQLFRLMTETRSLQAIMNVYRFFMNRMRLVNGLFTKNGLTVPKQLTFEMMAKEFIALCGERYPTPEKAFEHTKKLGLEDWILAKIIVLCQMRDAVREMAMLQIFGTVQHRDDLLMAILEALEQLEDDLDEENEEDDEDEEEDDNEKATDKIDEIKMRVG
jgi:type III secretion protein W